jgi:hypothetical protein
MVKKVQCSLTKTETLIFFAGLHMLKVTASIIEISKNKANNISEKKS